MSAQMEIYGPLDVKLASQIWVLLKKDALLEHSCHDGIINAYIGRLLKFVLE